ncbi:hypothetical protein CE139_23215 [Pseudomonas oryzihabitans]|uniref:histidine kinase n=1 Tax=Pseudomonas oryzihabitans TaxID=47885 RepID=A0A2Z5AHF2_9PSED|nr:hypothetical protein CE139_23215 [Pseudomonas oryzihabitans]
MPMILTDPHQPDNPIIFVNNAFVKLSGYPAAELLGRNCRFLQGEETSAESVAQIRQAIASQTKIAIDIVNYRKDGQRFVNELYISPVLDPNGELLYFFGSQVDVTAYTEARLSLQLTLIERERYVLSQIAEGHPLGQVLEDLLRVVEAQSDAGMRTSILFVDEEGKRLRHGAAPSLPRVYNQAIDGILIGEGVGSCGTVASRGTPVYTTDIARDPLWVDFKDLALAHDLHACWSTPIKAAQGTILGTFAIYYDEPRSPTASEIAAIGFVTQTAALAIERHRHDLEMRRGEEKLQEANEALKLANARLHSTNENLEKIVQERTAVSRLYGDIVQSSAAPICAFDSEYRLIAFNQAHSDEFYRIFNHRVQLGEVFPDLFPADQSPIMRQFMTRALQGEAYTVTEEFGDPNLAKPVWEMTYSPLRDSGGHVMGAFHYARDISARLRMEHELNTVSNQLAEQNAARERTWQFTPDLLSIIDMNTATFERVNPSWSVHLGYATDEIEGRPYANFIHPDDIAASDAAFETVRKGSPVLRFENRYRAKDGSWHRMSWTAFPEGNKLYSSTRDVTQAYDQAAKLAERTQERDRLWQLSADIMLVADGDGTIEAVNPAWTRILGWGEDELLNEPLFAFVHTDDVRATMDAAASIVDGKSFNRFHNRYRHRDGSYRDIVWSAGLGEGKIIAVGRDATEDKARERALAEAEEALRQSQKMEAVGQLTGGLAHDFNNLLAGISGSLELMHIRMQQGRHQDVERYMTAAQGAAKRAAALTHRLLAFSRRQTLDPRPIDVTRLAMGMQDMIQRTVGPGIPIEVVGATSSWPALVDPSQLENALLNLCINARDAMPDGGRITIETANKWMDERAAYQHQMPEGQYLSLSVSDTGSGMPQEIVKRAFEPFFTTKPIGEGTGLGLSMIYGFAQQSGGQVRIYSEVGEGTTVTIYLPRYYGTVQVEGDEEKASELPRSEKGETVLIVDDEPTVRMLITDILEDLGYLSIEAGDSVSGLRVLQSDVRIDLLVSDVGLPGGMNGRQMADAARAFRPDLKVLFITGYAENALLGKGQLAPGMAVLTKPFAMDAMAARIRSMIEAAKDERS